MRIPVRSGLVAFALSAGSLGQAQTPEPTTVPLDLSGVRPVIEVYINGDGPFRFVLDTGASQTVVSKDLCDRLRLPEIGSVLVGAPNSNTFIRAPQNRLRELRIGDLKFFGVKAVSLLDDSFLRPLRADGVISAEDFRGYLVTLDYRQRQMVIEPGRLPEADALTVFDSSVVHGIAGIELDVAGVRTFFHLDTGSPFFIALPGSMLTTQEYERKPTMVGTGSTVVGSFVVYSGRLAGDVKVGRTVLQKPQVEVMERMPVGNLGSRFFRDFRVTFDYASERVRIVYWKDALVKQNSPQARTATKVLLLDRA